MKRYPTIIYFSCVNRKCIGKKVGGKKPILRQTWRNFHRFLPPSTSEFKIEKSVEGRGDRLFNSAAVSSRMEYRFKARNPLIFSSARTVEDYYPVFAEPFAKILPLRSSIPFHECMNVFSPFFLFLFLYN